MGTMRVAAGLLAVLALGLIAREAHAQTYFAPFGGRSIRLEDARVVCPDPSGYHGWVVDPDGHGLRPPPNADAAGQSVQVPLAADVAHCATPAATLTFVTVGAAPSVDRTGVAFDVDAGTVTLHGHGLANSVLRWSSGGHDGVDICRDVSTSAGIDSCTYAVARDLGADPATLTLTLRPASTPMLASAVGFDAQGRRMTADAESFTPTRVTVSRVLPNSPVLDVQAGDARIALPHPDVVAGVDCTDALCDFDGTALSIRNVRVVGDGLAVRVRLRPHAFGAHGESVVLETIAVQRCPIAIASLPPLRGVSEQRVVLRIGAGCPNNDELQFAQSGGEATLERSETVGDARFAVVHLDRVSGDAVSITVLHHGSVVGVARTPTVPPPASRARIEIPGHEGTIDFIPTNRDARVIVPTTSTGAVLVPSPIAEVYTVTIDGDGHALIRGAENAGGSVALHFAYRDRSLPAVLRDVDLATLVDPVQRPMHAANLPIHLGSSAASDTPVIELQCADGAGHMQRMTPGTVTARPFGTRDSCRIVLHRERLQPEDGAQALHLSVDIIGADGAARPEARIDQVMTVVPDSAPRFLYITGVTSPFDRVVVRASLAMDDTHYVLAVDDRSHTAQAQWSVVFGRDHFRMYATAAIPTGLFRVAIHDGVGTDSTTDSGILTLNAGAIMRLVWLSSEGHESPIGLEAGVMWVGIAGDTAAGSHGEVSVVGGLGVGVPIANASHASQTSINLHLWFEYEPSRPSSAGSPIGVIFGPSISIGDVGANF